MLGNRVPIKSVVVICVIELSVGFSNVWLSAHYHRSRALVSRFDYNVLVSPESAESLLFFLVEIVSSGAGVWCCMPDVFLHSSDVCFKGSLSVFWVSRCSSPWIAFSVLPLHPLSCRTHIDIVCGQSLEGLFWVGRCQWLLLPFG